MDSKEPTSPHHVEISNGLYERLGEIALDMGKNDVEQILSEFGAEVIKECIEVTKKQTRMNISGELINELKTLLSEEEFEELVLIVVRGIGNPIH